jgi:hypothetical protein
MDDAEPNPTELICRLLSVMPARFVAKIANRLAMIYGDTGHGEIVITVYRGKVVQIDMTVKDR